MKALADVLTRLAVVYLAGAGSPPARPPSRHPYWPASVPELASRPAAAQTVPVKVPSATAPFHVTARPGAPGTTPDHLAGLAAKATT